MIMFMIALPLLVLSSAQELGEQDALCGPSDACYAIFYQRRSFLESWRACRERGGNLATVKNAQEATLVEQLLTSSTAVRGGDGDLIQLRLWIGLQRQPRQCAPQKPLRGFTWTTGDQDTAYTNWAHQAAPVGPPGSCSAPRCVAIGLGYGKPEDDFKWLEGSCTLPVDGFVCKFRYQGMCLALAESNTRYSAPFGYQGTWLDRLPFGSVATVACEGQLQDVSVLCMLKEDGTVGWSKDEPLCQTDFANQCLGCQQLCEEGGVCACEEGYHLQPDGRSCEPEEDMSFEKHNPAQGCPCQYQCVGINGMGKAYQCICPEGYQLAADEHSCEDIDECEEDEEGPCEHSCQNAPGSYVCSCDLGFAISEEEPGRCVDVDECRIARVCQQMCVNYVGGFECYCSEGYELDADGVSCKSSGQRDIRYGSRPPVSTSEEGTEEEEGEWYPLPVEWEVTGTSTGGREGRWDSSQRTGGDVGWADHVDSWEEETTTDPELYPATTPAPFVMGWDEDKEITVDPTIDYLYEATLSHVEWEEITETIILTTLVPAPRITHVRMEQAKTTKPPTTSSKPPTTSTMPSSVPTTMKARPSVTETALDKATVALRSNRKASTLAPSTEKVKEMSKMTTLAPTRHRAVIGSATTTVLKAQVDEALITTPSPQLPTQSRGKTSSPAIHPTTPLLPLESRGKRDNRWLVVALLVPLCIFLVIMLALGIVYCTRCGGDTKPRSVTDCYHWVTGGGAGKGLVPSGVESPTCRTGV